MFAIVDKVRRTMPNGKTSRGPDLPEGVEGFLLLAEPYKSAPWALYEFSADRRVDIGVADELRALLNSALRYAPAMALSRYRIQHVCDESTSKEEFAHRLSQLLHVALREQKKDKFFLAEILDDRAGPMLEQWTGVKAREFVWLVARRLCEQTGEQLVCYVDWKYDIGAAPARYFAIDAENLNHLVEYDSLRQTPL